jgi:hypothetical protein
MFDLNCLLYSLFHIKHILFSKMGLLQTGHAHAKSWVCIQRLKFPHVNRLLLNKSVHWQNRHAVPFLIKGLDQRHKSPKGATALLTAKSKLLRCL